MLYRCGNCEWGTDDPGECRDISDFWGRVTPGEIMPEGECPECGCLVHCRDGQYLERMAADQMVPALCRLIEICRQKVSPTDEPTPELDGFTNDEALHEAIWVYELATGEPYDYSIQTSGNVMAENKNGLRTITIEVDGGVVQGVIGLPEGWQYDIQDFDDDPDDCVDEADYEGTGCGRGDFPAEDEAGDDPYNLADTALMRGVLNQRFDDTQGPTP